MMNAFLFYFFVCTIKEPFEDKLINNKTLPILDKLVIVFWCSWTVIAAIYDLIKFQREGREKVAAAE